MIQLQIMQESKTIMSKKKIFMWVTALILVIVIAIVIMWIVEEQTTVDAYDVANRELKNQFNADIMVYGDEIEFRKELEYRRIESINEDTLYSDDEHAYRAILLFDESGKNTVTDEEWLLMKSYVEEKGYDMVYIGTQYLDDLVRLGFTVHCDEDERSLSYIGSCHVGEDVQQNEYGNLYAEHGIWTDSDLPHQERDEETLPYIVISMLYDYAKASVLSESE